MRGTNTLPGKFSSCFREGLNFISRATGSNAIMRQVRQWRLIQVKSIKFSRQDKEQQERE